MKGFLKIFFASCLSLIVFTFLISLLSVYLLYTAFKSRTPEIKSNSVLVLDLSKRYAEQPNSNAIAFLKDRTTKTTPGLHDIIRMLNYAKTDSAIKGLYIKSSVNPNGYGTSGELRNAILNFRESGKFVIAYGETIDQKSYYVASAAQSIYCHPNGGLDWAGLSITYMFYKGLIDKLGINPQIFYAGKFKSATEPFRVNKMTEPNRAQTTDLLNDIYGNILSGVSASRNIDTATLHRLADSALIRTASDAVKTGLIDDALFNDQVQARIQNLVGEDDKDKINWVSMSDYDDTRDYKSEKGDQIAVLYAEGDIADGNSANPGTISSDRFIRLIRKIRLDKDIKAVVFRVNSPGGSALASDGIWREITLLKKEKPVVVSMGDYAASGGYYISCAADSILAEPETLTGSIGVFRIVPDLGKLLSEKLGVTFDGVKTGPYADMGTMSRPMTEAEKRMMQASVDSIYLTFKTRVSDGRKLDMAFVDSIAQGHVYTGKRAIGIRLVDKTGYLPDAVEVAARMTKAGKYQIREFPEEKNLLESLISSSAGIGSTEQKIKEVVGENQSRIYREIKELEESGKGPQARLMMIPEIR